MRTQMLKYTQNVLKRHPYPSQAPSFTRAFSSSPNPERKVTVLGSSGGVGQQLSLLLKLNPLVSYLSLFDYAAAKGVMKDISHIPTRAQVVAQDFIFPREDEYKHLTPIELTLEGSDLVIIPAGILARPGMTHEEIFAYNAAVVRNLCGDVAKYCPKAFVNIISNQVNSTVPIAAEVFKKAGTYDPKRLFGVTTLDVLRAKNFYADKAGILPNGVDVPVVGGHAGITTLPLFSQAVPQANLSQEDIEAATKRTQDAGTEVVLAKGGRGSATLSMAFAGAVFADACLKGLNGVPDVVEYSYVQSEVTELPFFASKVRIGLNGVEEIMGLGSLSDYEQKALETLIPELKQSIDKGVQFINKDT